MANRRSSRNTSTPDNAEKSGNTTIIKLSPTLVWTIFLAFVSGAFGLGVYVKGAECDKKSVEYVIEKKSLVTNMSILENETERLQSELNKCLQPQTPNKASQNIIFIDGQLTDGLDMGVNTSGGAQNWVKLENNTICMDYPDGQTWGAVFITVGKPTPWGSANRKSRDYSAYTKLIVEMKGTNGATVEIGVKGIKDPDNGSEKKVALRLNDNWNTYEINLKDLMFSDNSRPDMKNLYVVTEFVFAENSPQTLYVRNIQYK